MKKEFSAPDIQQLINPISTTMLGEIIDNLEIGIVVSDPNVHDNPLIYINRGFEKITGYSKQEVVGTNCRFLQGEETDKTVVRNMRQLIKEQKAFTVELINYRKDGKKIWNELNVYPVFDERQNLVYFVGVQKDISARKKAEFLLEDNLQFARKIQRGILSKPIVNDKISIYGFYQPSEKLGGDLYYWQQLGNHHYGVLLLDVVGHGIASSLISMMIRSYSSEIMSHSVDPAYVVKVLNDYLIELFEDLDETVYCTAIYLVIDTEENTITYVSCGHPYAILIQDGEKTMLDKGSLPIGLVDWFDPVVDTVSYKLGSKLVLYTDGIGDKGLNTLFDQIDFSLSNLPADHSKSLLREIISKKVEPYPLKDDVTLISIALT